MNKPRIAVMLLAVGGLLAAAGTAEARERHRARVVVADARPLTVTKRSWLDVGNVVPVGTQDTYLSANTFLNRPTYATYTPAKFGQSVLPDQFSLAFSNENPRGPTSGGIFFDELP